MKNEWTDSKIQALKPQPARYSKRIGRGLYLFVEPTGTKIWRLRYTVNGRTEQLKLGEYPNLTLSKARVQADVRQDEAKAARKGDSATPAQKARSQTAEKLAVPTVTQLAKKWISLRGGPKTKAKRRHDIDKDVIPVIGTMRVNHVTKGHCLEIIDRPVSRGALAQANELFKILRALLRYAVACDYMDKSPMVGIEPPSKYVPKTRHLDENELLALFASINDSRISEASRLCIEWQILTAVRPTEAREARWSEIIGNKWIIPADRVKNSKEHTIYLSSAAQSVLEKIAELRQDIDDPVLFPGVTEGKALSNLTVTRALYRLQKRMQTKLREITGNEFQLLQPFTLHDLRRTAATTVTRLGFSRFVAGMLLNHTHQDNSVTAIYDQHDYEKEKTEAWEKLGEYISSLAEKGRSLSQ